MLQGERLDFCSRQKLRLGRNRRGLPSGGKKFSTTHIVNDIVYTGEQPAPTRLPSLKDDFLDGRTPDVLVIGGGISGASIARELTKWKLDVLLVDKGRTLRFRRRDATTARCTPESTSAKAHSNTSTFAAQTICMQTFAASLTFRLSR